MGFNRIAIAFVTLMLVATAGFAFQPPAATDQFVPMNELPPADQLPAAPLLITAYAFVWVALLVYVWTVWRRLGKVETEMRALAQRSGGRSHPR